MIGQSRVFGEVSCALLIHSSCGCSQQARLPPSRATALLCYPSCNGTPMVPQGYHGGIMVPTVPWATMGYYGYHRGCTPCTPNNTFQHRWLAQSTTSTAIYCEARLSVGAISYCWSYSASARFAWVARSNLLPSAQSKLLQIAIISRLPSQSYSLLITIVSNLFSSNQLCHCRLCSQVLQLWAETASRFPLVIILHRRSSFALCKIFAYWYVCSTKLFNNIFLTWCFLSFVHQL